MTETTNNTFIPGQSVFVRWYHEVLQGEVVQNNQDGILKSLVAVRVPIMGTKTIALFLSNHVYLTQQDVPGYGGVVTSNTNKPLEFDYAEAQPQFPYSDITLDICKTAKKAYENFKREHWDQERGHLQVDALEEFYQRYQLCCILSTARDLPSERFVAPWSPSPAEAPIAEAPAVTTPKQESKKHPIQLSLFD